MWNRSVLELYRALTLLGFHKTENLALLIHFGDYVQVIYSPIVYFGLILTSMCNPSRIISVIEKAYNLIKQTNKNSILTSVHLRTTKDDFIHRLGTRQRQHHEDTGGKKCCQNTIVLC